MQDLRRTRLATIALAAMLMAAVAQNLNAEEALGAAQPPAVSVAEVSEMAFAETILVTGSLVPREEVLVTSQLEGYRIVEILSEEGDRVAKDQVLARLDARALRAQLAQGLANLNRAKAAIEQAKSQILQAEASLKQAEAAFERARELRKTGTTSQAVYDEREAAARTAAASLASARDGQTLAEAEKAQIEAQIDEIRVRLGYTDIIAPLDGLVSRRSARLGATVSTMTADPLFRIIGKGEIELDAEVPEFYLPKITPGVGATISVAGVAERRGTVRLVSPEIDKATRLGKVRIFIGDDPELRIGAFARGVITTATSRGLGVPASAVIFREDQSFVQVVRDNRVETRAIRTGLRTAETVEVIEGLKAGDLVVARSGTLLREGDAVRPVISKPTALSEAR